MTDQRTTHTQGADPATAPRPDTRFTSVDGRRIRYRQASTGDPLLLLHGIGCSLEDWDEQFDRLTDRFRLIALDLPGFAFSDRLAEPTTLDSIARFLPRFLAALDVAGPVHVIGNSLGGAIAMRLAADQPDLVRSLLLVNPAGFGREVALALRLLAIRPVARRLLQPSRDAAARTVRAVFADPSFVTDARIEHALTLARRPHHTTTLLEVAAHLGTVRGLRPQWRRDLLAALRNQGVPTLAVWGEHDVVLPVAHLQAVRSALPEADTHLFEGAGHMPQIERADAFAELAGEFFTRHPAHPG